MDGRKLCLVVCAALLVPVLLGQTAGVVPESVHADEPTPVPFRQLIFEGTLAMDEAWLEQHPDADHVHTEVPIPGPGYVSSTGDCYRLDAPPDKRDQYWCAYVGGYTVVLYDTEGELKETYQWVDGGTAYVDVWNCLSSNLDRYPYACDIQLYWDPDSDADKVPDWRDECPNAYVETSDPDHSNGCPPTPEPTIATCDLELYVSPENLSAGEVAYLTLRALRGEEPIAGEAAQVVILDGPGTVLEGSLTTNEYGEVEFTYQAPGDIPEQTTVQLMGTVAGCPDDAATAFLYLRPEVPPEIPTPTVTPLPVPFTVWVDRVVVLQSIEGAQLVAHKPAGVRVFLRWNGFGNSPPLLVSLFLDGELIGTAPFSIKVDYSRYEQQTARNSANFHLDRSLLTPGWHTLEATVKLASGQPDADPSDDSKTTDFMAYETRPIYILFNTTQRTITLADINKFVAEARVFFEDVYPIPYMVRVPGGFLAEGAFDTMLHHAIAGAQARALYNSRNGSNYADFAVGLFPTGHHGDGVYGASFWWDRRSVLVDIDSPESLAHEIGHYYLGGTEEYETDPPNGRLIANLSRYRGHARLFDFLLPYRGFVNFMGNAGLVPTWVNPETSDRILHHLRTDWGSSRPTGVPGLASPLSTTRLCERVFADAGPAWLLSGYIDADDRLTLEPVYHLERAEAAEMPAGDYTVEAQTADGGVLASLSFAVALEDEVEGRRISPFVLTLPASPETAQIVFKHEDQVIHTLARSASPPAVEITSPTEGETMSGSHTVTWLASDPDGDVLRYALFYSPDGGQRWVLLAANLSETTYAFDTSMVAGGSGCLLMVLATDGMNTISAVSPSFTVADKPPQAYIVPVQDESVYQADQPIIFQGAAFDLEDGDLPPDQLRWLDAEGQLLEQGPRLDLTGLPPGEHVVFLVTQDSTGQTGQAETTFTVLPPTDEGVVPPPEPPAPTPLAGLEPLAGLLCASVCGWVLVVGGILGVVVFARRRSFAKVLLVLLIGTALILTVSSCLLGLAVFSGGQPGVPPVMPTPLSTPAVSLPTPPAVPSASPTLEPPQVSAAEVTLVNNTGEAVCYVYISPAESAEWGEDWLGTDETILPGASRTFQVPVGTYDLLAEDCDYNTLAEEYGVDIFEALEWTIGP